MCVPPLQSPPHLRARQPASRDRAIVSCAADAEVRFGKSGEFLLQIRIGHRPREAADRVLDPLLHHAPVGQGERDRRGIRRERRVDGGTHATAEIDHRRVAHCAVTELPLAAVALDQRDRGRVEDTEFAFEPGSRFGFAGQLQHQRMHAERNRADRSGLNPVMIAELHAGIDRGVDYDTAGERLVAVGQNLVARAECLQ